MKKKDTLNPVLPDSTIIRVNNYKNAIITLEQMGKNMGYSKLYVIRDMQGYPIEDNSPFGFEATQTLSQAKNFVDRYR